MEPIQQKVADVSAAAAITLGGVSFTVTDVLQFVALALSVVCGAFSLYFHIKKYRRERTQK